eukprot:scaffold7392_cov286-Pinguiococcus_pyrenoidosus.AAC.21
MLSTTNQKGGREEWMLVAPEDDGKPNIFGLPTNRAFQVHTRAGGRVTAAGLRAEKLQETENAKSNPAKEAEEQRRLEELEASRGPSLLEQHRERMSQGGRGRRLKRGHEVDDMRGERGSVLAILWDGHHGLRKAWVPRLPPGQRCSQLARVDDLARDLGLLKKGRHRSPGVHRGLQRLGADLLPGNGRAVRNVEHVGPDARRLLRGVGHALQQGLDDCSRRVCVVDHVDHVAWSADEDGSVQSAKEQRICKQV